MKICIISDFWHKSAKTFYHQLLKELKDSVEFITYSKTDDIKEFSKTLNSYSYIITTNATLYKHLTKSSKVENREGIVTKSVLDNYCVYLTNYSSYLLNPNKITLIQHGISNLLEHINDVQVEPKEVVQLTNLNEIKQFIHTLTYETKPVTVDIEGFSLKHYSCGIGSIAFGVSPILAYSFTVDTSDYSVEIRKLLKHYFQHRNHKCIYHNASFDITVLIYQLFMSNLLDQVGLLNGLEIMTNNIDDTYLISYLCLNSCSRESYSLKTLAQPYLGDWGVDVTDITTIPTNELLEYNGLDSIGTYWVYEKYSKLLKEENQVKQYNELFLPSLTDIIQMQLTGIPINMQKVLQVNTELNDKQTLLMKSLYELETIQQFQLTQADQWVIEKNKKLKVKRVTTADYKEKFNPNSSKQVQALLFDYLKLPVISYTQAKQPSVDRDTLKALAKQTKETTKQLLEILIDLSDLSMIISTFLPAFMDAQECNGWHYLFGSFKLGGTVSGRMSSNSPNLQNIPSKSKYGEVIKSCVEAPKGYLFVGLDYSSLEDKISALTTKDVNKLDVYVKGFDGHSLRAYAYFQDQLPDITNKLNLIEPNRKYYKIIHDDESVEYVTDQDERVRSFFGL